MPPAERPGSGTSAVGGEASGGQASGGQASGGDAAGRADPGVAGRGDLAGAVFARLTVAPAILIMAWLLPGLPLLAGGAFTPVAALLLSVPLAVAAAVAGPRLLPARRPGSRSRNLPGSAPRRPPGCRPARWWSSWWPVAGTAAVAAGFIAWQLAENSPALIVTRGPGVYLQAGYWIAQHGSLPIPRSAGAFGGAHPGLVFASTGFAASGASIVPTVTPGLPLLLAGAFWVNGVTAAAALSPVLGGLAILAFGGLIARLAGARWAPAGALVLALTLPEQYVSRSAFSEPLVQILLFGGLCLVIDWLTGPAGRGRPARPGPAGRRLLALAGGLALGLTVLADAGSLVPLLAVIPFAAVAAGRRQPGVISFCCGIVLGAGYGLAGGYLLAGPFMTSIGTPLEQIGIAAASLAAISLAAVGLPSSARVRAAARRAAAVRPLRGARPGARRWLPEAGGAAVAVALILLAIRPYLQIVRGQAGSAALEYVAHLQRAQHLPVDPGRLYAEDTLYWVIWYAGVPAVLLGGFGFALLVRRCLRALVAGRDPAGMWRRWGLVLAMIGGGSAAVLWMPYTVPDQPWASRRLLPVVIPGLVLCATWAACWLTGLARDRGAGRVTAALVGLCCTGALAVPAAATTFGLGLRHDGHGGLSVSADGLALRSAGAGEPGAVTGLCAAIPRNASVLIIDSRVMRRFAQVIRGMCGVPVAGVADRRATAGPVLSAIMRNGRSPLLLAASRPELRLAGGRPARVLVLATTQYPHALTQPPAGPAPARYVIWMAMPGPAVTGA